MKKLPYFVTLMIFLSFATSNGQQNEKINPRFFSQQWDALWISHPEANQNPALYLFKKVINLETVPTEFVIHVSADNRYKLYINEQFISEGPARGDFFNWRYETIDIAPFLKKGENIIGAKVWYFGALAPEAQLQVEPGFILQGNSENEAVINTDQKWEVLKDDAFTFFPIDHLETHYVVGPGEMLRANKHPWKWLSNNTMNDSWVTAKELEPGAPLGSIRWFGNFPKRSLTPRKIPFMEYKEQYFQRIRRLEGIKNAGSLLEQNQELIIPAASNVTILLDQNELTNAYPQVAFSKGTGSEMKITYGESLYETTSDGNEEIVTKYKGNREEVKGKKMWGNYDIIFPDGGDNRLYETLWWRTFRYVQLEINTKDEPLILHRFNSMYRAFPMKMRAAFLSNEPVHKNIFDVSWRTQRLCAGETFFDCPYYEQCQYEGDTRIQTLNTFYASGDTMLWRRAIQDFYDSRLPFGLTLSRYPNNDPQIIPTYSLIWIWMLHDYWMLANDSEFIEAKLPLVEDILYWFQQRMNENNLPGNYEGWNFVDWVNHQGWKVGTPPGNENGNSSISALHYIFTIQKANELYAFYNRPGLENYWRQEAEKTQKAVLDLCWDDGKGILADTPNKRNFSQHANVLAVLTNTLSLSKKQEVIKKIYNDSTLAQCSYYFRFYLAEALKETGLSELYFDMLTSWEEMLDMGLTTFIEKSEPSRSDCHAWSASPLYHFYTIVCGISPLGPGFKKIQISPVFGDLEWIQASFPHPKGDVVLDLKKSKSNKVTGNVSLPEGLKGNFLWKGEEIQLVPGITEIKL